MSSTIDFYNQHILVIGFAQTGQSVAEYLLRHGAKVTLNDREPIRQLPEAQALLAQGVEIVDGEHSVELLDQEFDFIVKNPGVPYSLPILELAVQQGLPIYTDVELASWQTDAKIIGITGSNGKTTTTQLIYDCLYAKDPDHTYLAGNIGISILDDIEDRTAQDTIVTELSSFQLMGTDKFHPSIAVITNLYSAHLDYHGTREEYVAAKCRLLRQLTKEDYFVYNYDQEELRTISQRVSAQLVPFARQTVDDYVRDHGAYYESGSFYYRHQLMFSIDEVKLPGAHNIENVLAAMATAILSGVSPETIRQAVSQFHGMPHRIQLIETFEGVCYYNDSKATNPVATITALKSFEDPVRYIGGGLDRGIDFMEMLPYLESVTKAYVYGESKNKMAQLFKKAKIEVAIFNTLEEATTACLKEVQSGEVVLFSPANASWDQFKNYELRGEAFSQCVHSFTRKGN